MEEYEVDLDNPTIPDDLKPSKDDKPSETVKSEQNISDADSKIDLDNLKSSDSEGYGLIFGQDDDYDPSDFNGLDPNKI